MKDWIRSQRQGREGVGLIFIGPIELRNGDWYGAVVCMGSDDGGLCDCADMEDGWQCTEGIDALTCYLDAGVPGTGIFEEGGNCEENEDNPACPNPFLDCETGCEGCNCCAAEAPPPGPDGVACSKLHRIVPWSVLSYQYGEYIHDPDCPDGKMQELFDYLETRGFDRDGLRVSTFRTNDDPKDCKVEIWGELPPCDGELCPTVSFDGNEDDAWPGITAVPSCSVDACPELRCLEASDLEVDVLDEWQAGQVDGIWKDPAVDGPCPDACSSGYACYYPCYKGVLAGCENLDSEEEAIACGEAPDSNGNSWPDRGYLVVAIECGSQTWSAFIVCCYDCLGFGDACFVCLSGTGDPQFPQGGDPQREPGWEDDVICRGYGTEEEASVQSCDELPPDNIYKEVLRWTPADEAPEGCDTEGICDPPFDDEAGRRFDKAVKKALERRSMATRKTGPGTELKKLLSIFGFDPNEKGCKCKSRAAKMDKNGIKWCEDNIEVIVGWLAEEAKKRKLPYLRTAGRLLVRRAIRNAKRNEGTR